MSAERMEKGQNENILITFAGITKNEEDIEVVTKTYYVNKYTGKIREGELCSATNMDMSTYFSRGGDIGFRDFKGLLETDGDDYEEKVYELVRMLTKTTASD